MDAKYMSAMICLLPMLSGNNYVFADKNGDGICEYKATGIHICCTNYVFSSTSNRCEECVGRFGINCSQSCPTGFFGKRCDEKCSCSEEMCDKISGCRNRTMGHNANNTQENGSLNNAVEDLGGVLRIALYGTLTTLAVLVGVSLIVLYRKTKSDGRMFSGAVDTDTNLDIALPESQPSVIYAAVESLNRRPAGGAGQNDVMYGNILRCEDQKGVRNPGRQLVHPGTENLTEEYFGTANLYSVELPLTSIEMANYSEVTKKKPVSEAGCDDNWKQYNF